MFNYFSFCCRLRLICTYCEATNHESRLKTIRIRAKPIQALARFSSNLAVVSDDQMLRYNLDRIGYKAKRESHEINSVLLLKSDESIWQTLLYIVIVQIILGQTFRTTYVLRTQITLKQQNRENTSTIALKDLDNYLSGLQ